MEDERSIPFQLISQRGQVVKGASQVKHGYKSGFVSIIGSPNVGKSTLMNTLIGYNLSSATHKKQTTRHRIKGIISTDDYQIIYDDTPGVLLPQYKLHTRMMNYVYHAIRDADALLFVTDIFEEDFPDEKVLDLINDIDIPLVVAVNKIDMLESSKKVKRKKQPGSVETVLNRWQDQLPRARVVPICALNGNGSDVLLASVVDKLPLGPPMYEGDVMSDKPMRFFASEIILEQIFLHTNQEVPYSSEVVIDQFLEEVKRIRIRATIVVSRSSQMKIMVGQGGSMIKAIGTAARLKLQTLLETKVRLDLTVKTNPGWRTNEEALNDYGYG
eukprot:55325_1